MIRNGMVVRPPTRCSISFSVKSETLDPTLFNQPSLPLLFTDSFVYIFFPHAAMLHCRVLDCTLDAEGHFVR